MVAPTDSSNVRPVWFVTGGSNWWRRTQFWQCGDRSHDHRDDIREMQPSDQIAMKVGEFWDFARDEQGNRAVSVGIYAVGKITGTRDHFVDVDDDWRKSMPPGRSPIDNPPVGSISDRFPASQCIWRMEPNDAATRAFITEVLSLGVGDRSPSCRFSSSSLALADELYLPANFLEEINTLLTDKKQIIFQGPPGTGKTYVAQELAQHLAGSKNRVTLVQFHPSYDYVDFVQGYRPAPMENGQPGFKLQDGPLLRAAKAAEADPAAKHFLIIDEINRGNLAKVFGELYFLLEYRNERINLQYSDAEFSLPENLYIIGTMNTADRSIALVDLALRRRFYFVEFHPDKWPIQGLLRRYLNNESPGIAWVADVVDRANELLSDEPNAAIGPSYFMKPGLDETSVRRIWQYGVLPYIEERLFGQGEDRLAEFDLDRLRSNTLSTVEDETIPDDAGDA